MMDKKQEDYSNINIEDEISEKEYISEEEFVADHPVPQIGEKYITIGAFLIATYGEPYETLALMGDKEDYEYELEQEWEITDKEKTIETINWLLIDGHTERNQNDYNFLKKFGYIAYREEFGEDATLSEEDFKNYILAAKGIIEVLGLSEEYVEYCQSLVAWDLERVGLIVRMAFHVGYLTEEESLSFLEDAAKIAKDFFESWEEYLVSVIIGRSLSMEYSDVLFASALDLLKDNRKFLNDHPLKSL